MTETIISAAIHQGGCIISLPSPARHHTIIKHMVEDLGLNPPINGIQGFLTNTGRFVNRTTAYKIAFPNDEPKLLYSEDLW